MIEAETNSVWNSCAVILPVTIASPLTTNLAEGDTVPIPTFPVVWSYTKSTAPAVTDPLLNWTVLSLPAGAADTPVNPEPLPVNEPEITAGLAIENVALLSVTVTTIPWALPVNVSASVFKFTVSLPVDPDK